MLPPTKKEMKYPPLLISSNPGERQQLIEHIQGGVLHVVGITQNRYGKHQPHIDVDLREEDGNGLYNYGAIGRLRQRIFKCRLVCFIVAIATLFVSIVVFVWWNDGSASSAKAISSILSGESLLATTATALLGRRHVGPCYNNNMSQIHVPRKQPGFPSFLDYAHGGPIQVSYDERSLKLNGDRVFFLGGSMHPARATQQTWNNALDEAVQNGLNLITIYVMWADHQPFPDQDIDWSFDQAVSCQSSWSKESCDWSLATAIRSAAERGLFVHLRLGP